MTWPVIQILEDHHVPYVVSGPNTAKGNVSIKCPFCGAADPSEHLGINLKTGSWNCWRSSDHRGHRPHRLLVRLLGVSYAEVDALVGSSRNVVGDFERLVAVGEEYFGRPSTGAQNTSRTSLSLPKDFRPLSQGRYAHRYVEYLRKRGFEDPLAVAEEYDLRYCLNGYFKGRIILPVYMHGQLVTWTGRDINPAGRMRYLTLTTDPHKAKAIGLGPALRSTSHCLPNVDELKHRGGEVLCVVEGPFDYLKLDYYGKGQGVRSVCLFTKNMSEEQLYELIDLMDHFKALIFLLDEGAETDAQELTAALASLKERVRFDNLAKHGLQGDPGSLTKTQVEVLCGHLRSGSAPALRDP